MVKMYSLQAKINNFFFQLRNVPYMQNICPLQYGVVPL